MSKRFSDQFRQSAVEMVWPENPIAEVAHSFIIDGKFTWYQSKPRPLFFG